MFESMLMQLSSIEVQGLITSIVALAIAIGTLAGLIAKFIQTYTNNQKIQAWASAVARDLEITRKSLQATDQWLLETQQKFVVGFKVINELLTPEQQKQAAALGFNILQWQKEVDWAAREIENIYSVAPAEEAARIRTPTSPL